MHHLYATSSPAVTIRPPSMPRDALAVHCGRWRQLAAHVPALIATTTPLEFRLHWMPKFSCCKRSRVLWCFNRISDGTPEHIAGLGLLFGFSRVRKKLNWSDQIGRQCYKNVKRYRDRQLHILVELDWNITNRNTKTLDRISFMTRHLLDSCLSFHDANDKKKMTFQTALDVTPPPRNVTNNNYVHIIQKFLTTQTS